MHWLAIVLTGLLTWNPLQPPTNLPRYSMHVDLDYAQHRLAAQAKVELTNRWREPLSELVFHVPPARIAGVFKLDSLTIDDSSQPPSYGLRDGFLTVQLPRSLPLGARVAVFMAFTLVLPPVQTVAGFVECSLGWSDVALNAGHWHPVLVPYDPLRGGWQTWKLSTIGDPYVTESADYEVDILAPPGVKVAGGGEDLREGNHWRYWLPAGREFGFVASDRWEEAESLVGGVRVHSYFLPEHRAAGLTVLQAAADALRLYSDTFGPYPYRDFRIVETRARGGMEFPGFSYLTDEYYAQWPGNARSFLVYTTVHEVAHQWWYNIAGNDQVYEPWLDEALADYCAWLFYRVQRPDDAEWWWNSRVNRDLPALPVDATIYQFDDNMVYLLTVYRRGILLFTDLEKEIGQPRLFSALRGYLYRQAYRLSNSDDLLATLTRYANGSLAPVLKPYLTAPPWLASCADRGERCTLGAGLQPR
ncbi:MAG: M1 family metallopeptidase [Anaerolineae bacterium]|nr:M1 family metallopeptidase [Anaerolineae bacterium]